MASAADMRNRYQSVWLSEVSGGAIDSGQLKQAVGHKGFTGAIFSITSLYQDLHHHHRYDRVISSKLADGVSGAELLNTLIAEDTRQAADILRPVYEQSDQVDGWVISPLSPLVCTQTREEEGSLERHHTLIDRPNVLHMVPGLAASESYIEEAVYSGFPIAVSLICSPSQYTRVARSYLKGMTRRLATGRRAGICALVVVPITRIFTLLAQEMVPDAALKTCIALKNDLSRTIREWHTSQAWESAHRAGARPLRLLWMITPAPDSIQLSTLLSGIRASPLSITAIPETGLSELDTDNAEVTASLEEGEKYVKTSNRGFETVLQYHRSLADTIPNVLAMEEEQNWIRLLDAIARKSATLTQQPGSETGG